MDTNLKKKGNLKTTGEDTIVTSPIIIDSETSLSKEIEYDTYKSDGTYAKLKKCIIIYYSDFSELFVLPSGNEVDKKLFSPATKWMSKMAESDNKMVLLKWYDSDMREKHIRSFKDIPTELFVLKNILREEILTKKDETIIQILKWHIQDQLKR